MDNVECLVDAGVVSESDGDELREIMSLLPGGEVELLKLLVALNILNNPA